MLALPKALFFCLIVLQFLIAAFGFEERVIELGAVIRPSELITINATVHKGYQLGEGDNLRLKTNYIIANLERANVTVIRYQDIIPFSAKGCMPVFYIADNPPLITRSVVSGIHFREQWTVVLFGNPVEEIDKAVVDLFARSIIIVGTFIGKGLARKCEKTLLNREIMVISNLVPHELLGTTSGSFTGYMLLFELLTRSSVELPLLANLVLMDHGKNSLRCSRRKGRGMELLNHDFMGKHLPTDPETRAPQIVGDEVVMFPEHYVTHIDAPYHLIETGTTAELLPEDRMFVPCIRVQQYNVTHNLMVGVNVFREWEFRTGFNIPEGSYVFVDTGNNRKWPYIDEYLHLDPQTKEPKFMGIDPDATRWLVMNRRIYGLGIDTMSTDGSPGWQTKRLPTHVLLAKEDAIGIENVARVDRLPNLFTDPRMNPVSKCLLVHLRIEGGTGAPVAIFLHTEGLLSEAYDDSLVTDSSNVKSNVMSSRSSHTVIAHMTLFRQFTMILAVFPYVAMNRWLF